MKTLLLAFAMSICGSNDLEKMIDLDDQMKEMGRPIGILTAQSGSSASKCTGTLIDKDLFLTAEHCYGPCSGMSVKFGYLERQETFKCKEVVEKGNGAFNRDYMILRLEGTPGAEWGYYPLSDRKLQVGQELLMIHHPSATPMKVSRKDCKVTSLNSGMVNHRCDTESGSSGSAILVPDYENPERTVVVGVHTLGGCNSSPTSSNSGPAIEALAKVSSTIKQLSKP